MRRKRRQEIKKVRQWDEKDTEDFSSINLYKRVTM
jgi:hypothetical protein